MANGRFNPTIMEEGLAAMAILASVLSRLDRFRGRRR
jgi:hypothetical protein